MAVDAAFTGRTEDPKLSYERTVERSLVHRAAVAEVFVTDLRGVGSDRFLAGAQLPLTHGYYNDHRTARPVPFDTLLLLESCRQASTYGAHRQFGVPLDSTMLVKNWSIRLAEDGWPLTGHTPGELGVVDTVTAERGRDGQIRGMRFEMDLWFDRQPVGQAHIEVGCLSRKQYAALRYMQRGSVPPQSKDLLRAATGRPDAGLVSPELVGRGNPANVVLADPTWEGSTLTARLAAGLDNGSMFDHDYDHYPAMVLMEAARQISLLADRSVHGRGGAWTVLGGFEAEFERFAELDAPVFVRTEVAAPAQPAGEPIAGYRRAGISFTQHDKPIGRSTVLLGDNRVRTSRTGAADRQGGDDT